ncbi:MAG TPA: hypothetical protein VF721_02510 [Pyrinomonadaceae bacterium]|jgi:hypothetical protein
MNRQNLQNKKLDEIGRKLLETARVPNDELDRIVAAPKLFDAVKAGIKAEQRERQSKTFSGNGLSLLNWNWQKTVAAIAVLMFFALGLIVFTNRDSSPTSAQQINPPQIQMPVAPAEISPPIENPEAPPEIVKTKNSGRKNHVIFRKAVFKDEPAVLPKRKPQRNKPVKPQPESEPEGEFYALAHAGMPGETGENLRIVRAELSRSSLFALGVNLPIENESEKIKTDLLVGADGIAKAIRFVK